jgi:putative heme-binding domain-containing protein
MLQTPDPAQIHPGFAELARQLAISVGAEGEPNHIRNVLYNVTRHDAPDLLAMRYAALAGLGEGLARKRRSLADVLPAQELRTQIGIRGLLTSAASTATNHQRAATERIAALGMMRWLAWDEAKPHLLSCLAATEGRDVQQATLRILGTFNVADIAEALITRWKQLTPPLREEAVNVLLSRPIWQEPLIGALEKGEIPIAQVSIPQRTRLANIRDEKLAERAKKVLASFALGPRKEVIDRYQESLALKGEASRGQVVYRRECMNCHKLRGEGFDVGPSLETVQHRSPQEILIHVLDPNREVSPNFLEYTVRLNDGRVLTGLISAETDAGLTLRRAQNQEDNILRSEIDEIGSGGKSLMPEGMEQKITPQEMADLIAYLRQQPSQKSAP